MPKRKAPTAGSSDGTLRDWGASVSGRQRRLERRLPRQLWRSRWARRFPMAEPACLAISSRKARNGSQRISKRNPASSHHRDRVHRLAPRPTRGIGFNGGTRATKKRPACARRSASVALFGAHSDDYMPECDDRSSHRSNQLVNGGRPTSGRCGIRSIRSPEGHRPARPPPAPRAASSLGTSGRLARMCRAGPRAGSVSHRNRPVGNGHERSQAASETAGHSALAVRPRAGEGGAAEFESPHPHGSHGSAALANEAGCYPGADSQTFGTRSTPSRTAGPGASLDGRLNRV
jgi:hypothetical protein